MRLDGFDIFVIEIPRLLQSPREPRRGVRTILVRVRDETGLRGWGESPTGAGADETSLDEARDSLRDVILPALTTFEFASLESVSVTTGAIMEEIPNSAFAAFCGAELALLDLMGRRLRRNAGDLLGPPRQPAAHYGGVISSGGEADVKLQAAALRRAAVRDVKLTVGNDLEGNLARLEIARQILGPDVELRVTADGCWDSGEAVRQLEAMLPFRLAAVEQPVPAADVDGLAAVTRAGVAPVVARDNVVTARDAKMLAARRACDGISVSISRCGGLANSTRIHRIARDAGLGCQLGVDAAEIGIVAAAGLMFATRCEGIRWCEFPPCLGALAESVTEPPLSPDLAEPAMAPKGHGLGVRVLEAVIDRCTSQRISVS